MIQFLYSWKLLAKILRGKSGWAWQFGEGFNEVKRAVQNKDGNGLMERKGFVKTSQCTPGAGHEILALDKQITIFVL